ncbi:MAG: NAD(+) synthase [Planctomycetia bacterium]|nr:NAD(+) synthase [Planctomycetia bacterium]
MSDSKILADVLGIEWIEISIEPIFSEMVNSLHSWFSSTDSSLAKENMQSRIRADLLMSWSNTFGHLVLATSNKSEVSVGYSTLYGDMSGALSPIADLWKTEVYELADWLNARGPFPGAIPSEIILKAPSAELRPDQRDTDSLPEYEILDRILQLYIEQFYSAEMIATNTGIPMELISRVIRLTNAAEYKRWQAPPGCQVHAATSPEGPLPPGDAPPRY